MVLWRIFFTGLPSKNSRIQAAIIIKRTYLLYPHHFKIVIFCYASQNHQFNGGLLIP